LSKILRLGEFKSAFNSEKEKSGGNAIFMPGECVPDIHGIEKKSLYNSILLRYNF